METITIVLTKEVYDDIQDRLGEIIAKIGPYKMDQMEFAWSVMNTSTENARFIKEKLAEMIVQKEE